MFRKALTIENAATKFDSFAPVAAAREQEDAEAALTDEARFEIFYREHSPALWSYVCRVAGGASEIADDVVQESFLRFLAAPAARSRANEKAYLYRIATNLTYDYFRRSAREIKRRTNLADVVEIAYEQFNDDGETARIFGKLKMQERALLWLAYVEGRAHGEIAEILGLKSLSVRVLLFRARRRLAVLLDADNFAVEKL